MTRRALTKSVLRGLLSWDKNYIKLHSGRHIATDKSGQRPPPLDPRPQESTLLAAPLCCWPRGLVEAKWAVYDLWQAWTGMDTIDNQSRPSCPKKWCDGATCVVDVYRNLSQLCHRIWSKLYNGHNKICASLGESFLRSFPASKIWKHGKTGTVLKIYVSWKINTLHRIPVGGIPPWFILSLDQRHSNRDKKTSMEFVSRYHIIAQLAIYTTYIPGICCQLGDYMVPTTFFAGTRKQLLKTTMEVFQQWPSKSIQTSHTSIRRASSLALSLVVAVQQLSRRASSCSRKLWVTWKKTWKG